MAMMGWFRSRLGQTGVLIIIELTFININPGFINHCLLIRVVLTPPIQWSLFDTFSMVASQLNSLLGLMNPGLTLLKSIGCLVIFCYLQAAKKGLSSDLEKTCWDPEAGDLGRQWILKKIPLR